MSTTSDDRKTESNRANAKLSTGPRTPEGKAVSSLNGTTHGLAANRISPKNPEALANVKRRIESYTSYYNCGDNPILADLVEDLAHSRVRKDLIEERLAQLPDDTAREYELMHRYLREANRCYYRALREIEAFQSRRIRFQLDVKRLETQILKQWDQTSIRETETQLASLRREVRALVGPPVGQRPESPDAQS